MVDTEPPEVTLGTVPTPSNDVTPSFSGTASESLPVTVKVYKGSKAKGSPAATAEGAVSGGKWGPVSSSTTLSSGTYTVGSREKLDQQRSGQKRITDVRYQHGTARSDLGDRVDPIEQHETVVQRDGERIAAG